jgi:hypothetical protein
VTVDPFTLRLAAMEAQADGWDAPPMLAHGTPVQIVDQPKHMWSEMRGWTGTFVAPHRLPDTSILNLRGSQAIVHNDDFEVTG